VGTEVSDTTLGAVAVGQCAFKARGDKQRPKGLAGFSGVNGEGFAGKVLFAIFPALGPFGDFSNFVFAVSPFKLALVVKEILVFLVVEQVKVVLNLARFGSPVRILGVLNDCQSWCSPIERKSG
jgi:hypothetical protein